MTVAQQNSVAVSCDPACAEIKARLAKLENMMTRVLVTVDKISSMKTSQCLSSNKLEILIARLMDATQSLRCVIRIQNEILDGESSGLFSNEP